VELRLQVTDGDVILRIRAYRWHLKPYNLGRGNIIGKNFL
jgi:hypothetical protein